MSAINRSAVIIRPLPPYLGCGGPSETGAKRDDTTDIAEPVFEDRHVDEALVELD